MKLFDKEFFIKTGAAHLSEDQRKRFIAVAYEELETRVGQQLADGMTPDKLNEFEKIINNTAFDNVQWLKSYFPDYQTDMVYLRLKAKGLGGDNLINETASSLWLQTNRPDYQQVVRQCYDELCAEIAAYKDVIFAEQDDL